MVVAALGPLLVNGVAVSPRERAVLGALLVRHGTTVIVGELADAVWRDQRPATWHKQLQAAIAILRRTLGAGAIVTEAGGYRMTLRPEDVDTSRFSALVERARKLASGGESDRAVDLYQRAFALWRGRPFVDLEDWPEAAAEADRLEQLRVVAEEEALEQRLLVTADARSVIPEAERQVRAAPLRESRWALLARANYRAGRQVEALAALRAARARLIDEAGVEPGRLIVDLEASILRQDPELDAVMAAVRAPSDGCPYRGLASYGTVDAEAFFGRDAEVERILAMADRVPLVVLTGASGCGKSSLLSAGVLPRIAARGVTSVMTRPTDGPTALRDAIERADVVVVDQLEELFHASDPLVYASIIADAIERGRQVLATLRSDFLDDFAALLPVSSFASEGIFVVPPMGEEALRAVIEAPAVLAGLRLETGLVPLMLRDALGHSEALPHLSHAMVETWLRREGSALTVEGYQASGGITGAIAQSAEQTYQALSLEDQRRCRALMLRLMERTPDGVSVRRRIDTRTFDDHADRRRTLYTLVAARLIVVDGDAAWITHEAIATAWPRLDQWLDDDVESARLLRHVETAAVEWDASGRGADDLWRGARLSGVLAWREESRPDLTVAESAFLSAAVAGEEAQLREVGRRAERDRSQNRRLRWSLVGAAALLVVAIVAGGLAAVRSREASMSAEDAKIEALAATSMALRGSDRDVAALLAAEAYRRWPDDARVRSALMGTVTAAGGLMAKHAARSDRIMLEVIPGTDTALQVGDGPAGADVSVIDLATAETLRSIDLPLPTARSQFSRVIAFSEDGRIGAIQTGGLPDPDDLATCCVNDVVFFEVDSGHVLSGSQLLALRTGDPMALGATGDTVYIRHSVLGSVTAIDTHTGEVRSSDPAALGDFTGAEAEYNSLAWVPAAGIVVGGDAELVVYDPVTLQRTDVIDITPGTARMQVVSDGAGGVISSGESGIGRVDLATGVETWSSPVQTGDACVQLEVAPRGDRFYCSADGEVAEYAVDTGLRTGRTLVTELDTIAEIGVMRDGRDLIVSDYLSPVWMTWRLDGSGPASDLQAAGMSVAGGFGGDGRYIIAFDDARQSMQLWDVDTDTAVGQTAERLTWLGNEVLERWSEQGGSELENVMTGDRYPLVRTGELADLPDEAWFTDGGSGPRAFAVAEDSLVPFDPLTGTADGPALRVGEPVLYSRILSIDEAADGRRVVVTWWDFEAERSVTTVFDGRTGSIVAQGLYGMAATALLASGDIVGASPERLVLADGTSLGQRATLSKPAGGSLGLSVSDDGVTVLNAGWNHVVTLYDLTRSITLGDTLAASTDLNVRAAYLSRDGDTMVHTSREGILVWDMDPADQFEAACRIAGRELTTEEWRRYLDQSEPRVATCARVLD